MQTPHPQPISAGRRIGRRSPLPQLLLSAGLCIFLAHPSAADELPAQVGRFIQMHCAVCHSGPDAEAGLDLAKLPTSLESLDDPATFALWVQVHDRVQAGEMPPADVERPAAVDVKSLLQNLGKSLPRTRPSRRVAWL